MKIGVFDSGIGGKSVANAIKEALPEHQILYVEDTKNVPYGTKSPNQLLELVTPILRGLVEDGAEVLVIACNTVTTTIIEELRQKFDVPFIGIEPMLKPASKLTKSKIIAVCATPTTLASKRYKELLQQNAQDLQVIEPDCSEWAFMIEQNAVDEQRIRSQITSLCQAGADVIVLGCTHYHWIEEDIKEITVNYNTAVIQPEQAVVAQLKRVIAQLD